MEKAQKRSKNQKIAKNCSFELKDGKRGQNGQIQPQL